MWTNLTFSRWTTDEGKAEMILDTFGELAKVKVTDVHGGTLIGRVRDTTTTPDGELMLIVWQDGAESNDLVFLSEIVSVESK